MKPYFQDDWATIYHGDCREILPQLTDKVDLVLTDPPYGINIAADGTVGVGVAAPLKDYGIQLWDTAPPSIELFNLIRQSSQWQIIFGGNYFSDRLPVSKCWVVWDKGIPDNFTKAQVELIWTNLTTYSRLLSCSWNGMIRVRDIGQETRWHPTEKPIRLLKSLIMLAKESSVILDPFMGSGTTLAAAKGLGKKAIGIELEERYVKVAIERLRQSVMPL